MNTLQKEQVISTKRHYEVRKSSDPEGPAIKQGNKSKFQDWRAAWDFVTDDLCDIRKPLGEYDDLHDYIIVEVETIVRVDKAF